MSTETFVDAPTASRRRELVATVAPGGGVATTVALGLWSLFVGVIEISPGDVFSDPRLREIFLVSRVPRTLALILSGASMAAAGLIMQHLTHNRFVAPTTAGTVDAAGAGMLAIVLIAPGTPVMGKVLVALAFALAGTALFVGIVHRVQFRDPLLVPLLGLILGGIYRAGAEFFAFRHNLTQSLFSWFNADFSGIIEGRYETLWLAGFATALAYLFANRFMAAGMGEAFATNIGVNYRATLAAGLTIVALTTAIVVVTVGAVPFLGLIVPNIVTLILGDNLRRVVPVTALAGATMTLACDIVGRLIIFPYEVAVGTIVGVAGSVVFLVIVMRGGNQYARA